MVTTDMNKLPPPIVPPSYGAVAETVVIDNETTPFMTSANPVVVVSGGENGILIGDGDSSPHWRDVWFAIVFWIHVAIMIWLGIYVAPLGYSTINIDIGSIEDQIRQEDVSDEDLKQFEQVATQITEYVKVYPLRILLYLIFPCCILAFFIAFFVTVFVVKPFAKSVVYASLLGSLMFTALFMIASSLASGSIFVFIMTGIGLAAVVYYIGVAWRMVPFAAVNLKVALEGMNRNCGIYFVGFLFAELGFLWVVFWTYTLIGVSTKEDSDCRAAHPDSNFDMSSDQYDDSCDPPFVVILLFLLSLYWTSTVMMNTIQVTVAGAMATWCFDKREADNCCSSAVSASLYRSMTYSFGSICFGSLLQAIISVLRFLVESARNSRDQDENGCGTILLCILECLTRLLEDIMEYFNQWAYVFVGIYGYSYLESGRRVIELFRARGWTSIITNNLVGYVLGFITVAVGVLTGIAGIFVEYFVSKNLHDPSNTEFDSYLGLNRYVAFALGFVIGVWVCSVMMNVIKGAVNTLIVCWADSPAVLEAEHTALTREMAESWTSAFPDSVVLIRPAYAVVV